MTNVVIIDDEPLARSVVAEYLSSHPQLHIAAQCADGFEGLKAITQLEPALIFLDVQMPKINGFEMLELIEQPPAVIFTTAFDEYALKAFEANAVDYLLKPFSKDRFDKAITKWQQAVKPTEQPTTSPLPQLLQQVAQANPAQHERIVVKIGSKIKIVPASHVQYIEAADDYVKIHTAEGSFLKNKTMQYFEDTLPAAHFVRVHRGAIVAVEQITRIDPYEKGHFLAILRNGARVPVSKAGYSRLRQVLGL
ncbi:MAG TPA: LytTR family transcriptional regulator DNA-binding domain-containing protein [Phnomibacter sp.]|nr:LytTR family transcriptional regulator DNA-binding domain-containing protein [Phnomibacter sp.]